MPEFQSPPDGHSTHPGVYSSSDELEELLLLLFALAQLLLLLLLAFPAQLPFAFPAPLEVFFFFAGGAMWRVLGSGIGMWRMGSSSVAAACWSSFLVASTSRTSAEPLFIPANNVDCASNFFTAAIFFFF